MRGPIDTRGSVEYHAQQESHRPSSHFSWDILRTYVPHAWDLSDLEEKVAGLIESPNLCAAVAAAGQRKYLNSLSQVGGEAVALHLAALVRRAMQGQERIHT